MKLIASFILALPEIIRLIDNIQKRIDEEKVNSHVKKDLEEINKAFEAKDAKALKAIFNS